MGFVSHFMQTQFNFVKRMMKSLEKLKIAWPFLDNIRYEFSVSKFHKELDTNFVKVKIQTGLISFYPHPDP